MLSSPDTVYGMINDIKRASTDIALLSSLNVCSRKKDIRKGIQIHAEISKGNLLDKSLRIGNALVNMYAKCGEFGRAQDVFEELPVRNLVTWTALASGYVQNGNAAEALRLLECMQLEGFSPNQYTYVCIFKACGMLGMLERGRDIHAKVAREGYVENNIVVGTSLVDMYSKCGAISHAQEVFDCLLVRNVVTWNLLMQGYIEHGHAIEALQSYELMQYEGLYPDEMTFVCVLKACGEIRDCNSGRAIHMKLPNAGMHEERILITTALVDMYAKCGALAEAKEAFDAILLHNLVLWTTLISAYAQHAHGEEALMCYGQMQQEGFLPDSACFTCITKACASMKALRKGTAIHVEVVEGGWLKKDACIGTSLVDMYASCGSVAEARKVFDDLPAPNNVASWTSLMAGYAQLEQGIEESLRCFQQMQQEGIPPDVVTHICVLKECGTNRMVEEAGKVHAVLAGQGLANSDLLVGVALIDMYAGLGMLSEAQGVFDELRVRNQAAWNALIVGYARNGYDEDAISCFRRMQRVYLTPDLDAFPCILRACGNLGALDQGQQVHAEAVRGGVCCRKDMFLSTALVDLYAKCGACVKAQEVFDGLLVRDVVAWNALISGYAQFGDGEMVWELVQEMMMMMMMEGVEGVKPNAVSFTILLASCNHSGELSRAHVCFEAMQACYGIVPTLEHYTCLADLLGRVGCLEGAVAVLRDMHLHADALLWRTLLASCWNRGNLELAKSAFGCAVRFDEDDAAIYVLASNAYAMEGDD